MSEETVVSRAPAGQSGRIGSPPVVPPAVRQCSVVLAPGEPDGDEPWHSIELPAGLEAAVARRQRHFRAGRYCAREALRGLSPAFSGTVPGRAISGAPVWPAGTVGSITHTDDFASAAVAWEHDAAGVGIDTEHLVSESRARAIAPAVVHAGELERARAAGLDPSLAFTLLFSAKEAVFKCLYRHVGRVFGFHDARIASVDLRDGAFTVELVNALAPGLPAGMVLHGRFALEPSRIHTGITLAQVRCEQ